MDEVNHVKMVVSFVLFCCAGLFGLFLYLHNGYERSINVLIGEKIAKKFFFRCLECFIALRYRGYITAFNVRYVQIHFHFKGADFIGVRSRQGFPGVRSDSQGNIVELDEHFCLLASQGFFYEFSVSLVACVLFVSSVIFFEV